MIDKLLTFATQILKHTTKYNSDQNWHNDSDDKTQKADVIIPEEKIEEKWCYPVKVPKITSPYGWRIFMGKKVWHNGTDYSGKYNKKAIACCDMIIRKVLLPDEQYPVKFFWSNTHNKFMPVQNIPEGRAWTPYVECVSMYDKNIRLIYRHIKCLHKIGDVIEAGEEFCEIGNYGYCQGSHLHFEIAKYKNVIDHEIINGHDFITKKIKKV